MRSEYPVLASPRTEFFVSAVSIWEMRLKYGARHRSGIRKSRFSPEDVADSPEDQEVSLLPKTMRHAAWGLSMEPDHKDPFDELLPVQAQEEGLRLLTVGSRFLGHPLALATYELG